MVLSGWRFTLIHLFGKFIKLFSKTLYHRLRSFKWISVISNADSMPDDLLLSVTDLYLLEVQSAFQHFREVDPKFGSKLAQIKAHMHTLRASRLSYPEGRREAIAAIGILNQEKVNILKRGDEQDRANFVGMYAMSKLSTLSSKYDGDELEDLASTIVEIDKVVKGISGDSDPLNLFPIYFVQLLTLAALGERVPTQMEASVYRQAVIVAQKALNTFNVFPGFAKNRPLFIEQRERTVLLMGDALLRLDERLEQSNLLTGEERANILREALEIYNRHIESMTEQGGARRRVLIRDRAKVLFALARSKGSDNRRSLVDQAIQDMEYVLHHRQNAGEWGAVVSDAHDIVRMSCALRDWAKAGDTGLRYLSAARESYFLNRGVVTERAFASSVGRLADLTAFACLMRSDAEAAFTAVSGGRSIRRGSENDWLGRLEAVSRDEAKRLLDRYRKAEELHDYLEREARFGTADHLSSLRAGKSEVAWKRLVDAYDALVRHLRTSGVSMNYQGYEPQQIASQIMRDVAAAVVFGICEFGAFTIVVRPADTGHKFSSVCVKGLSFQEWAHLLGEETDGWTKCYTNFVSTINDSKGHPSAEPAARFNSTIDATERAINEHFLSHVATHLEKCEIVEGKRVRVLAPGFMTLVPVHLGHLTEYGASWPTCFSSMARLPMSREKATCANSVLVVANPTGDLLEPDWGALVDGRDGIDVLRGPVTSATMLSRIEGYSVAIFYCHAKWNREGIDQSGLILGNGTLWSAADIRSTVAVRDVHVILTCCESGLSDPGDFAYEGRGLAEAFLDAGAASVIATHWPIYTATAIALLERLFALPSFDDFDPIAFVESFRKAEGASGRHIATAGVGSAFPTVPIENLSDEAKESGKASNFELLSSMPLHRDAFSVFM
ncbi:CHAT domain-containing protein [Stakelama tenebrarum]|uniref:CHAT domain-containing protein n=1 Tax=Stakelama tenebrarum TaxID=2711215 RepID=A0A6G6Y3E8_9SPHN|nr:CHAT domain-containing protein [Sphingosinithalassobacter tenebrarum]QIG79445.1 CHAT domain-containing protein [Sphingosinithalassobacter tenebrarum]